MKLPIKRLHEHAVMPRYAHAGDAGLDLCSVVDLAIGPGEWKMVATGIAIELPPGTEAQVRPRSGLARDHGVTVLNAPGTIDEGYRGEIGVILINHGPSTFQVRPGTRIAQLVVQQRLTLEPIEVESLSDTPRGPGGFGSTGR